MHVLRVLAVLVVSCGAPVTPTKPEPAPTEPMSAAPTPTQWRAAEEVLRAHVTQQNQRILDVARSHGLGTTFWVRYDHGDGRTSARAAFVRGRDVLTAPGAATLSEILRRDRFLVTRYISARDFYDMVDLLEYLPKLRGSPQLNVLNKELHPSWSFGEDGATYTLYASRPVSLHPDIVRGDTNTPVHELTRARLTIRPDYSIVPWAVDDIDLPAKPEQQ